MFAHIITSRNRYVCNEFSFQINLVKISTFNEQIEDLKCPIQENVISLKGHFA